MVSLIPDMWQLNYINNAGGFGIYLYLESEKISKLKQYQAKILMASKRIHECGNRWKKYVKKSRFDTRLYYTIVMTLSKAKDIQLAQNFGEAWLNN